MRLFVSGSCISEYKKQDQTKTQESDIRQKIADLLVSPVCVDGPGFFFLGGGVGGPAGALPLPLTTLLAWLVEELEHPLSLCHPHMFVQTLGNNSFILRRNIDLLVTATVGGQLSGHTGKPPCEVCL